MTGAERQRLYTKRKSERDAGLPGLHIANSYGEPSVLARLGDLGQEVFPRDQQTPGHSES